MKMIPFNPVITLNVIVFFAGVASLLIVAKHYRFYKRAEGHELAHRVMILFLSKLGDIISIMSYKFVGAVFPEAVHNDIVRIGLNSFQLLTTLFSCWAAFHLYQIYMKYKDDIPKE